MAVVRHSSNATTMKPNSESQGTGCGGLQTGVRGLMTERAHSLAAGRRGLQGRPVLIHSTLHAHLKSVYLIIILFHKVSHGAMKTDRSGRVDQGKKGFPQAMEF